MPSCRATSFPSGSRRSRRRAASPASTTCAAALSVALSDAEEVELDRALDWQRARALPFEVLSAEEARAREPALGAAVQAAFAFPEDGQVSPARLRRGLAFAAARAGARVATGAPAPRSVSRPAARLGVETAAGFLRADAVVNAAGALGGALPGSPRLPSMPLRRPVVLLDASADPDRLAAFRPSPAGVLVPRRDGRLAVAGLAVHGRIRDAALLGGGDARCSPWRSRIVPARRGIRSSRPGRRSLPRRLTAFRSSARRRCRALPFDRAPGGDGVLLAPAAAVLVADLLTGQSAAAVGRRRFPRRGSASESPSAGRRMLPCPC